MRRPPRDSGATPQVDMLTVTEAHPPAGIADRLRVDDDSEVVVRSRRYLLDGKPVETAVSYIPVDLAKGTPITDPNPGPGGIYARLEEQGRPGPVHRGRWRGCLRQKRRGC